MRLIDTHAHLYLEEFRDDIDMVIQRSIDAGIIKIVQPSIDSNYIDNMLNLEDRFDNLFSSMIGLHPNSVDGNYMEELKIVEEWLPKGRFVAIGEIGIDLYRGDKYKREQTEAFIAQIKLAKKFDLPIVIHCRNAFEYILSILEEQPFDIRGIIHCFYGSIEQASRFVKLGIKLGIGGIVTFREDEKFNDLLLNVGIDNIVLETDSPYLSPKPNRGKRNESSYIVYTANKLSKIYKIDTEQIANITTINALDLFSIK